MLISRMEVAELDEQHEKVVLSAECQLVTVVSGAVPGLLEVTTQHVCFYDCSPERVETEEGMFWWEGGQVTPGLQRGTSDPHACCHRHRL